MCGEVENGHHYEGEVDPEIVGKDDDKDTPPRTCGVDLQRAPAGTQLRGVTKAICEGVRV